MQESACVLAWWPSPCPTITICRWVPEHCRLGREMWLFSGVVTPSETRAQPSRSGFFVHSQGSYRFCFLTSRKCCCSPLRGLILPSLRHGSELGSITSLSIPVNRASGNGGSASSCSETRASIRHPSGCFPLASVVRWVGGVAEAWRWGGQEVHSYTCGVGPWTSDLAAWAPERALILLCGLWGGAVATQGFLGWVK